MASVFPAWPAVVDPDESGEQATAHLAAASLPVALGGEGGDGSALRLFEARALPCSHLPPSPACPNSDAACFVGAPVWALDWRPAFCAAAAAAPAARRGASTAAAPASVAAPCAWLAVGTLSAAKPHAALGVPEAGPGALQLWRVPAPAPTPSPAAAASAGASPPAGKRARRGHSAGPDSGERAAAAPAGGAVAPTAPLPSVALLLTHAGGACWCLKWRPPTPSGGDGAPPAGSLGLLACCLGDGTIVVAAVPDPDALPAPAAPAAHGGGDGGGAADAAAACPAAPPLPPSLRLRPAFTGGLRSGGGGGVAMACAWGGGDGGDWSHDVLAAATTDGRVLLWHLPTTALPAPSSPPPPPSPPLQQLLLGGCDAVARPLRGLCFAAPCVALACGDDGVLVAWDAGGGAGGAPGWRGRGAGQALLTAAVALRCGGGGGGAGGGAGGGGGGAATMLLLGASDSGRLVAHALPPALSAAAPAAAAAAPAFAVYAVSPTGSCLWAVAPLPPPPDPPAAAAAAAAAASPPSSAVVARRGSAAMCGADGTLWLATGLARGPPDAVLAAVAAFARPGGEGPLRLIGGGGGGGGGAAAAAAPGLCAPQPLRSAVARGGGGGGAGRGRGRSRGGGGGAGAAAEGGPGGDEGAAARAAARLGRDAALHACAWGAAGSGGEGSGVWLAAAGQAGVLRVLRLRLGE